MSPLTDEPQFSKLRAFIWPIQNNELKKFLPMAIMMALILFNYTLLRNTKDALLITAPACGAEVIPFLKLVTTPCAVLFFFVYSKLSNMLSRETLFYVCFIPFLTFFAVFAFIIYPNKAFLHPSLESVTILRENYPHFKWCFSLYGVWSFALFYVLSELWGVIVIALLFWQFANEITRTNEAKRFYSMFGFLGNLSLIAAGSFGEWIAERTLSLPPHTDSWGMSIIYMMICIVLSGLGVVFIYWWMNRYILTNPFYYEAAAFNKKIQKNDKPKLSMKESLVYLFSSKYLGFIALLVISYGMMANIIDVTWKSQIKENFPKANDYLAFMAQFSFWTGVMTMVFIFASKGIVRRFGWFTGALITPLMYLVTSLLFFAFIIFKDSLGGMVSLFGVTSTYMALMVGATQNILSKSLKYALFDPTKEMSYIPLDQELKVKGKAAVDVIGSRFGKSGGGFIQLLLLTLTAGNQLSIVPYLFGIILFINLAWLSAVKGLSKLYLAKIKSS
jgi:AAA family ATP:ADP antiporter